jgi:hypothetical protein
VRPFTRNPQPQPFLVRKHRDEQAGDLGQEPPGVPPGGVAGIQGEKQAQGRFRQTRQTALVNRQGRQIPLHQQRQGHHGNQAGLPEHTGPFWNSFRLNHDHPGIQNLPVLWETSAELTGFLRKLVKFRKKPDKTS